MRKRLTKLEDCIGKTIRNVEFRTASSNNGMAGTVFHFDDECSFEISIQQHSPKIIAEFWLGENDADRMDELVLDEGMIL